MIADNLAYGEAVNLEAVVLAAFKNWKESMYNQGHPAFTGTHNHHHPAYGAADADDDAGHSHSHTHNGDSDHSPDADHPHDDIRPGGAGKPGRTPQTGDSPGQQVSGAYGAELSASGPAERARLRAARIANLDRRHG